jgi:sphinganine C4-monooxygenase
MNYTACSHFYDGKNICLSQTGVPFYYSEKPSLVPWMSDSKLAIAAPVFAYWSLSLLFHGMDMSGWQYLDKYRIHDSPEVQSRNRATRSQVVWAVVVQQVIQSILGVFWISDDREIADHRMEMEGIAWTLVSVLKRCVGEKMGNAVLDERGTDMVYAIYWWGIPVAQFVFAM